MILRPRWWWMLNNMSSCNVLTRRWGEDFTGKDDLIGAKYSKLLKLEMVPERWPLARLSFSLQTCVDHLDRRAGGMLLGSTSHTYYTLWITASLHEVAKCLTMELAVTWPKRLPPFSERFWHTRPRSCRTTVRCIYFAPITGYSRFTRNYCTHRPAAMLRGNKTTQQWLGTGCSVMPNHPNRRRPSASGASLPVRRIPYRYGFLPTGPQWCCNSCRRRRTNTGQSTRLGWTRKWLQWTFPSNGRRLGLTDGCSSRSARLLGEQHPAANRHH